MKHKGLLIWGGILAALGGIGLAIILPAETDIIAAAGIGAFRLLRALAFGVAGLGAFLALSGVGVWLSQKLRARKEMEQQLAKRLEAPVEIPSMYFESGRFNEAELRSYTLSLFSSVEPDLVPYLETYQAQMDRMNSYQARLSRMLQRNGASDLKQTELLLDKLEQSMFSSLRKAFNWIEMRDVSQEDREKLYENLTAVKTENDAILDKAGELCGALTDYINSQGENSCSTVVFDSFIHSLREQLEEVEIQK